MSLFLRVTVALVLLAGSLSVAQGWADTGAARGLRITYDMAGMPLTITKDSAGTMQFDGLPYPGMVLYRPQTGVMYYQHPDDPEWLVVQPAMFQTFLQPAQVTAGPAWQPWPAVGTPQPTRRWDVQTVAQDGVAVHCAPVFASPYATRMAGVTVTDMARVLAALEWLNAGRIAEPCNGLDFAGDVATQMGLPVLMTGPNGTWKLEDVVQADVPPIALPDTPHPVDDENRLQLLLVQFGPEDRAAFLKQYGELPVVRQIEMVSQQLVMDAQP